MPNGDDVMMTSESMSIRCPITQMIMKRPMKNRHCGHSYDYEGVEELIKQRTNKARYGQLGSLWSASEKCHLCKKTEGKMTQSNCNWYCRKCMDKFL